jgi:cysteinyl-tRNA synthetase
MGTHYRQALNFSFQACADARAALQRIDDFVARLRDAAQRPDTGQETAAQIIGNRTAEFKAGLEDDLNISAAVAALFEIVRDINRLLDNKGLGGKSVDSVLDALRAMDQVLGVIDVDREETVPAEILAQVEARQEARKNKDFAEADKLRAALKEQGWLVEDTPSGARVKRG